MSEHRVPGQLRYLIPRLADACSKKGKTLQADVLRHGTWQVDELRDSGRHGRTEFAVRFFVPPGLYDRIDMPYLGQLEYSLQGEINDALRAPNEHVKHVLVGVQDERSVEGPAPTPVRQSDADLWGGTDYLRLFISHRAEDKALASKIKENCLDYGISCFVAHEDIEPTAEWQSEITRALLSMDALVALLTADFHTSSWTDQEVGVAVGRAVPVIPVRMGCDPYGFIGPIQAIPGSGRSPADISQNLLNALLYRVEGTRGRMREALVARFEQADNYMHAAELVKVLVKLDTLPGNLIDRLERAPERNSHVQKAIKVQEQLPGLVSRLRGTSGQTS